MNKSIIATLTAATGLAALIAGLLGCSSKEQGVVVYVSEDQVFSEPILRDFERDTGIRVMAVYDTEEAKSTGVMNRLLAEKNNPQADVYWANEPIRAEVLKQQGIAAAYKSPSAEGIPAHFKDPQGYWTGFSARARVLIVNQTVPDKPKSITSYADPASKDGIVIANPLFGTTTTEIAALFMLWGDEKAKAFLENMKRNNVKIATSNGESADFVAAGQFAFALVDSDDAANRIDAASRRERHHKLHDAAWPGSATLREAAASSEWRKRGRAREPHQMSTIEHPYSSDLMPAALMTGPQRSISDLSSRASSAGVEPTTATPAFSMAPITAGSRRIATVSAESLFTISDGVLAGAKNAYQADTSKPGTPDSATVGNSNAVGKRLAEVTASPRT